MISKDRKKELKILLNEKLNGFICDDLFDIGWWDSDELTDEEFSELTFLFDIEYEIKETI